MSQRPCTTLSRGTDHSQRKLVQLSITSDGCLQEKKTSNKFGDRAFSICGPVLWNRLPKCMKEINSLDKFKKELKTHLFKEAFGWSQIYHYRLLLSSFMLYSCVLLIYEHFFIGISSIFAKCYWILYRSWHLKWPIIIINIIILYNIFSYCIVLYCIMSHCM